MNDKRPRRIKGKLDPFDSILKPHHPQKNLNF